MNGFAFGRSPVQRRENGTPPFVHLAADRCGRERLLPRSFSPPFRVGFICRASESGAHTNDSRATANALRISRLVSPLFFCLLPEIRILIDEALVFYFPLDFASKLYRVNLIMEVTQSDEVIND